MTPRSCNRLPRIRLVRHRWPIPLLVIGAALLVAPLENALAANIDGFVYNKLSGATVPGATLTFSRSGETLSTHTGPGGYYHIFNVTPGVAYTLTISAPAYQTKTNPSFTPLVGYSQVDPVLVPATDEPVVASASYTGTPAPGAALTLNGTCSILDGSTLLNSYWSQDEGVPATLDGNTLTLGSANAYKDAMIEALKSPPITADQLPPELADRFPSLAADVSDFAHGLQDRWQVTGINPWAEEVAADIPLTFTCETSSGTYTGSATVPTALPWAVSSGLRTVPIGVGVLLYGQCGLTVEEVDESADDDTRPASVCTQTDWNWAIVGPAGSQVALTDADTQSPWFTPDLPGEYQITESISGHTMSVYAGLWHGIIDPLATLWSVEFGDGRPVADSNCTGCHRDGGIAPDMFTPWRETGHAEIFTQNMTPPSNSPNGHYGSSCFACHTVGFDTDATADNNGFDDLPAYANFGPTGPNDHHGPSGLINSGLDGWYLMLTDTDANGDPLSLSPLTRLANVQCEQCHGPQDYTDAHGFDNPAYYEPDGSDPSYENPRVSLSANVCATCHGEPARHARFQQWQISGHADYELAEGEGTNPNCSRCHSANGFIQWTTELDNEADTNVDVTWNEDTVHPQTCVTCHEPHETGTTSGSVETNADVRISGDTPLLVAGFTAYGAGKGAICMTCHNSRRGLRNDSTWATTTDKDRAPHPPTQTDVLEGQNAYFVSVGTPGPHATYVEDTCVQCHMEKTLPPDELYVSGTNHTFAASPDVCNSCHADGDSRRNAVQSQVTGLLAALETAIAGQYASTWADAAGLTLGETSYDLSQIQGVSLADSRGSQALSFTIAGATDPVVVGMKDVTIDGGTNAGMTVYQVIDDDVLKAGWNYILIENTKGEGVHNPSFAAQALRGALDAVNALP